ncbi:MAG: ATP-binding protein, partial [Acidimicrobiales bacterium]|nr:ATP-binding protein [Acidimicrobiales bacterium]
LLTLLKQARAFGLGVVLSTQNPVDLDYKALSNTGTWMIGRLQTERDKGRLLDGLTAASGDVDVAALTETISGLPKRTFVLHETRAKAPQIFNTRWVMSYLAGPLSRAQIEVVAADQDVPDVASSAPLIGGTSPAPADADPVDAQPPAPQLADDESDVMPEVADGTRVVYVDPAATWAGEVGAVPGGRLLVPSLVARVDLLFDDEKAGLRQTMEFESVLVPLDEFPDPEQATVVDYDDRDLRDKAPEGAVYKLVDARIDTKTFFSKYGTALRDHLWRNLSVDLLANDELDLYGRPGETADQFAARCRDVANDRADMEAAELRQKYDDKLDRAELALAKAEDRLRELEEAADDKKRNELLSGAGNLLSVFLGGKRKARSLANKMGGLGRRRSQSSAADRRVDSAENRVSEAVEKIRDLEDELAEELRGITTEWEAKAAAVTVKEIGLEKADVVVDEVALAWIPVDR